MSGTRDMGGRVHRCHFREVCGAYSVQVVGWTVFSKKVNFFAKNRKICFCEKFSLGQRKLFAETDFRFFWTTYLIFRKNLENEVVAYDSVVATPKNCPKLWRFGAKINFFAKKSKICFCETFLNE